MFAFHAPWWFAVAPLFKSIKVFSLEGKLKLISLKEMNLFFKENSDGLKPGTKYNITDFEIKIHYLKKITLVNAVMSTY